MGRKLLLLDFSGKSWVCEERCIFVLINNTKDLICELQKQCKKVYDFECGQSCKLHVLHKTNIKKHPKDKKQLNKYIECLKNCAKNTNKYTIENTQAPLSIVKGLNKELRRERRYSRDLVNYYDQKGRYWKVKETYNIDRYFHYHHCNNNDDDDDDTTNKGSFVTLTKYAKSEIEKLFQKYQCSKMCTGKRIIVYDPKSLEGNLEAFSLELNTVKGQNRDYMAYEYELMCEFEKTGKKLDPPAYFRKIDKLN
jgi:hypothetical protein